MDILQRSNSVLDKYWQKGKQRAYSSLIENWSLDGKKIQAQIKSAVVKREKLVAAKRKEMAEAGGESTLGDAMSAAVGRQLKASGFQIKK